MPATAVSARSVGALVGGESVGLRAGGTATDYGEEREFEQARVGDNGAGWNGALVTRRGREGRYEWAIEVALAGDAWAEINSKGNWRLHHVRVMVAWDRDRSVVLNTLKLGAVK